MYKTNLKNIDLTKYYYDADTANKVVRYIETNIKHVAGPLAGQYLLLEKWQKDEIIKPIFGWKHKAGVNKGKRKFTSAYIEIPKKNGKTFLAAAFAAVFLDIEGEQGEVPIFSIAGNNDQARLTFNATKGIIAQSVRLSKKAEILANSIIVKSQRANKYFRALASKSETQQGVNPQLVIADEVHIHKDPDLIENQRKSMIAREQPLFLMITTAGADLYGVGYQEHTHAKEVVQGLRKDDGLLVCIYGAELHDDPFKLKTWKKANPNFGVSVTQAGLEREIQKAKHSKASLNSFLRYHLNIWTQSREAWIDDNVWNESQWPINEKILLGQKCFGGLDLSRRSDITAFTLIWQIDGKFISKNWFWLPEDKGSHSIENSNLQYLEWVNDGHIFETQGNVVDYEFIRAKLADVAKLYDIQGVAYDNWNSHHIAPALLEDGHHLIEFRQGFKSMNAPTKELEAAIMSKKFNHLGNPVLRWMAGNAEIQTDPAGNVKIIKDIKTPAKKVDGIISNVMAYALWLDEPEDMGSYMDAGELFII